MQHKRRHTPEEIATALVRARELYNTRPNAVLEAALMYSQIGWPVIPSQLTGNTDNVGKNPTLDNWQNLRITDEAQIQQHFQNQTVNVGVPTGSISGLLDFNLECDEAIELAKECLAPTGTIFGHASAPSSHWLYQCIEVTPKTTRQFTDPRRGEEPILELRADGGYQTILPGSIHVLSGEWVEWSKPPQQPTSVPYIEQHTRAVNLATRVMLARYCPDATKPDVVDPAVKQRLALWQRWQEEVEGAPAAAFEQTQKFLNTLDNRTDRFTYQTFDDSRERKEKKLTRPGLRCILHGTLAEKHQQLLRLAQNGAGIFVTINATNFKGRKGEDITEVRAYYADLDGAPLTNLKRLNLTPHIITETSPGRYGAYWLITDAPLSAEKFKSTQERLAELLDSDPTVKDLPRVTRLPGFPHQKELSSSPFMTQIVSLSERDAYSDQDFQHALVQAFIPQEPLASRSEIRNTAAHMQGHVGPRKRAETILDDKTQAAPKRLLSTATVGKPRERLLDNATIGKPRVDLSKGYEEGRRNNECARVAGSLLRKGYSEEETLAKALEWNERNDPPLDEEEVQGVVHSIAKSEKRKREGQHQEAYTPEQEIKYAGEIPLTPPRMLIKKLLPAEGMGFLAGQPSAGKTFMAIDLGIALTTATPFFGHRIKEQVGVLYIAAEGAGGINKRVTAAMLAKKIKEPIPFTWIKKIPDLQAEEGIKAFIAELHRYDKDMQRRFGVRLGLIILDTVATCFSMQDENSSAEAIKICKTMERISRETDVFILAVHHYGKDARAGLRGTSAWRGASETILSLTANIDPTTGEAEQRNLSLARARDDAEGPIAPYKVEIVTLMTDEDGDTVTSCIIKLDTQSRLPPTKDERSKSKKTFMEACRYAFLDHKDFRLKEGMRRPAVELKYVKEEFEARYVTGEGDPEKQKRATKSAWMRALERLPGGWLTEKDSDGDEWLLA
jgi:hypothetical protein